MRIFLSLIILIVLCEGSASHAFAQSPPVPQKKAEAIGSFTQKIEEQKTAQKQIEGQAKKIKSDLKAAQKNVTKIAVSIQKNETVALKLDRKIRQLEGKQGALRESLQEDQAALADLILALQRIRRLPPEALIVKPDAPLKTAQSAMLLKSTLPNLYDRAEALKENLQEMDRLGRELEDKRGRVKKANQELQAEYSKVSALVKKRETLYRSTRNDIKDRERAVKKIALQAQNLKELVRDLDEDRKRAQTRKSAHRAMLSRPSPSTTLVRPGKARLPISGQITTRYNEPDNFGAPSKGIDIEGRGGALVVAPMGGAIRFSGAFKNYGNMVIIEHKKGYHSLVAGLDRIDAVVGQNVIAGEPLGTLHYETGGEKPVLYYELRYNGKAVNPAKKFSGI